MAQPNPSLLQIESGAADIPPTPGPPYPYSLEVEFAGASAPGIAGPPYPFSFMIESAGITVGASRVYPRSFQIEYQGSISILSVGAKPTGFWIESQGLSTVGDARPYLRSLRIESSGTSLGFAARPRVSTLSLEYYKEVRPFAISVLVKDDGSLLSSMSKAAFVGQPVVSEVLFNKLSKLPQFYSNHYFSDPTNWRAFHTVYIPDDSDTAIPCNNARAGSGYDYRGLLTITEDLPTGSYRKAVLIEGLDGTLLLIDSTIVGETLTLTP